jgi:hypothetical protein
MLKTSWPSPAEMREYERAWRKETVEAAKREGDRSERARALVREHLKHGPRPIMAGAEAAEISEHVLIAAASALGVGTQKGQWWMPRQLATN